MQEFQSIPGLAGRLFGGGAGAGASDLRRAHHHHHQQGPGGARCGGGVSPLAEAVKCPRCESTNTKFCYYNNYNLSQPRHFCKSCRRYWTKGGVLRNVPVGGGCRKAKRSSSSSTPAIAASSVPSTPSPSREANKNPRRASATSPRSTNCGSPSPTAATTMTTASPTTTANNNMTITAGGGHGAAIAFSTVDVAPPAPIFADQAAALASLFAPPPPPPLPVFSFTTQQHPKDEGSVLLAARPDEAAAGMAPFTSLDAGIFEQLGDASAAYWSTGSCWTDPAVYLP